MPKIISWAAYFLDVSTSAARVLVGCGAPVVVSITSHNTRMFLPPRIGSLQVNTGLSMQSDLSPVACSVEEPSNPQIGGVFTLSFKIFVLERSMGVG